ncbi:MAG: hypothetical protein WC600_18405 [Desulfobaccales bacterium]
MLTQNASISKTEDGQFTVTTYKEFKCPACGRIILEPRPGAEFKIQCHRCGAMWKMEGGSTTMLRPPKKVAGKMFLDGVEKFYKK